LEQTLVLLKPDAIQRGLTGEIIRRLEQRGLKIVAAKFFQVPVELAQKHYAIHVGKSFYNGLLKYITASPVMAMVWEGPDAVAAVRQTMGATNPIAADPGTVRHDLSILISRNLTHASDSVETAKQEIDLWFTPDEIYPWVRSNEEWFTGAN